MMRAFFVFFTTFALILCSCDREHGEDNLLDKEPEFLPALKTILLNGYPDSVAKEGGRIFVSCTKTLNPKMQEKGEGFIVELSESGELVSENAFPDIKLNSPRGMVIHEGNIYVTDVNRILEIDLKTGKQLREMSLEPKEKLPMADIVITEKGVIYTVYGEEGNIYEIDLNRKKPIIEKLEITPRVPRIHGLAMEGDILYVAGFSRDKEGSPTGQLWQVDIKSGRAKALSEDKGQFDGIVVYRGYLFFSDWDRGTSGQKQDGAIRKMKLETGEISDVTKIKLKGVADFLIDDRTKAFWIPVLLERKLIIAHFGGDKDED